MTNCYEEIRSARFTHGFISSILIHLLHECNTWRQKHSRLSWRLYAVFSVRIGRTTQPHETSADEGLRPEDWEPRLSSMAGASPAGARINTTAERLPKMLFGANHRRFWGECVFVCVGGSSWGWQRGPGGGGRWAAASRTNQTTVIFVVAGPHFILLFVGGRFPLCCASFFLSCVCVTVCVCLCCPMGGVLWQLTTVEALSRPQLNGRLKAAAGGWSSGKFSLYTFGRVEPEDRIYEWILWRSKGLTSPPRREGNNSWVRAMEKWIVIGHGIGRRKRVYCSGFI